MVEKIWIMNIARSFEIVYRVLYENIKQMSDVTEITFKNFITYISDFMEASRIFAGIEGYSFIFQIISLLLNSWFYFSTYLSSKFQGSFSFPTIYFGGDFSGATQSRLLFIDETGKRYGEWNQPGLNYCLDGFDVVADKIAKWIQMAKKEVGIIGPLAAVVMILLSCIRRIFSH